MDTAIGKVWEGIRMANKVILWKSFLKGFLVENRFEAFRPKQAQKKYHMTRKFERA